VDVAQGIQGTVFVVKLEAFGKVTFFLKVTRALKYSVKAHGGIPI
jgi:hypothetical protein